MDNLNNKQEKVIGTPNVDLEQLVTTSYDSICFDLNAILKQMELFFGLKDKLDIQLIWEFLKSEDPKYFLHKRYVEVKKINFPNMDIETVIQTGLINVPKDLFDKLIEARQDFILYAIPMIDSIGLYFPLKYLWHKERRVFSLTDNSLEIEAKEFDDFVFKSTRVFTSSEEENQANEILVKFIDAWNDMFEVGFFPRHALKWRNGSFLNFVGVVDFNSKSSRPLSISNELTVRPFYSNLFGKKRPVTNAYKKVDLI